LTVLGPTNKRNAAAVETSYLAAQAAKKTNTIAEGLVLPFDVDIIVAIGSDSSIKLHPLVLSNVRVRRRIEDAI
jgi:hypothetical protein